MIYVFLPRALIACDTVVPLLIEFVQRNPREPIVFGLFAQHILGDIQKNVVLYEALQKLGRIENVSTQRLTGWARLRVGVRRWSFLGVALLRGLLGRATYVHFGYLNFFPPRLLFLANRRRTILLDSSPVGLSELESRVDRIRYPNLKMEKDIAAGVLVAQSPDWRVLGYEHLKDVPRYRITPPGARKAWHDYLRRAAKDYLGRVGIGEHEELAVCILCSIDPPNLTFHEDEFIKLLEDNLRVLAETAPDLPVVVKRHPKTTAANIQRIDDVVARSPKKRVVVADIHPMLLATRARFFLSNWTSTTYFNAITFRVPVIEYVHYAPAVLAVTGDASTRPDLVTHFINFDEEKLRRAIREVMDAPPPDRNLPYPHDESYETVLRLLARQPT